MSDDVDNAQLITEHLLNVALYCSRRDEPNATATGFCLYCDEPVVSPRRWCDAQCRDDWEKENG
jgi:hypothetical protein